jgi:GH25 family lysozyme M1 (1,4-beta-N-acetylmuramidase)
VEFADVSMYNKINWSTYPHICTIIRAGQGYYGTDPEWNYNWPEAKRQGKRRGVYWFYDDREAPDSQSRKLVNLIRDDPPEMGIFADWEKSYGVPVLRCGRHGTPPIQPMCRYRLPGHGSLIGSMAYHRWMDRRWT